LAGWLSSGAGFKGACAGLLEGSAGSRFWVFAGVQQLLVWAGQLRRGVSCGPGWLLCGSMAAAGPVAAQRPLTGLSCWQPPPLLICMLLHIAPEQGLWRAGARLCVQQSCVRTQGQRLLQGALAMVLHKKRVTSWEGALTQRCSPSVGALPNSVSVSMCVCLCVCEPCFRVLMRGLWWLSVTWPSDSGMVTCELEVFAVWAVPLARVCTKQPQRTMPLCVLHYICTALVLPHSVLGSCDDCAEPDYGTMVRGGASRLVAGQGCAAEQYGCSAAPSGG
jgi:hypothetical protein